MIKTIDRYLLSRFIVTLFVVVIAIGATIIVINMVENMGRFIDNKVPMTMILEYYIYFGGWVLKSFFPVFCMLAALFTISFLARKAEILAMKASGLSLYRIAAPILIVVMILSAGHFYFNEYIFPPANKKRIEIKEFDIKKRSKRRYEKLNNIYRQISPGHFYTIGVFNVLKAEGNDIKIFHTENNRLLKLTTASSMVYKDNRWLIQDGIERSFDDSSEVSYVEFDSMTVGAIVEKPSDLARQVGKPEDMGLDELKIYIGMMKRSGGPFYREQIDLKVKYAYPFSSLIVVLLSIPFAANPRRGGIAVSFAVGILIALVYFVLQRILQSAGYNEKIPEFVAVWGVNVFFFTIGLIAMFKARK